MLYFHALKDIRSCQMLFSYPGDTHWTSGTLNDMAGDLWDFHFDYKRWWQAAHKRKYKRLHIKLLEVTPNQNSAITEFPTPPDDWAPGFSSGIVGDLFGTTVPYEVQNWPYPGQTVVPPGSVPAGKHVLYVHVDYHHVPGGVQHDHVGYGTVFMDNNVNANGTGNGIVTIRDEWIDDFLVVGLNYYDLMDKRVVHDLSTPDPLTQIKSAKAQVVSNLSGSSAAVQVGSGTPFPPFMVFLFPNQFDVTPVCLRHYQLSVPTNQHDYRFWSALAGHVDIFGLQVLVPERSSFTGRYDGVSTLYPNVGPPEFDFTFDATGGLEMWNNNRNISDPALSIVTSAMGGVLEITLNQKTTTYNVSRFVTCALTMED